MASKNADRCECSARQREGRLWVYASTWSELSAVWIAGAFSCCRNAIEGMFCRILILSQGAARTEVQWNT